MRNIKVMLQYDGSRYLGWQKLQKPDKTIQGKLEAVISTMTGTKTEIIGSGRTDAGVHAKMQVANFHTECTLSLDEIQEYMNHYLPEDIVVWSIEEVDARFHSRYNAKGKKYIYYVWTGKYQSPFDRKYSYHFSEKLDIQKIDKAIQKLSGTHDFKGFSSIKNLKKSTVRTIDSIRIERNGAMLKFIFEGDGFLHNMIRIIVGTLLDIGTGKKDPFIIDTIFEEGIRSEAGITVPPMGLFLEGVKY